MNLKLKTKFLETERPQIALARELRIPEPYLSKIVNGWVEPKDELKTKIAEMLDCKAEDIFPDNEGPGK